MKKAPCIPIFKKKGVSAYKRFMSRGWDGSALTGPTYG